MRVSFSEAAEIIMKNVWPELMRSAARGDAHERRRLFGAVRFFSAREKIWLYAKYPRGCATVEGKCCYVHGELDAMMLLRAIRKLARPQGVEVSYQTSRKYRHCGVYYFRLRE